MELPQITFKTAKKKTQIHHPLTSTYAYTLRVFIHNDHPHPFGLYMDVMHVPGCGAIMTSWIT